MLPGSSSGTMIHPSAKRVIFSTAQQDNQAKKARTFGSFENVAVASTSSFQPQQNQIQQTMPLVRPVNATTSTSPNHASTFRLDNNSSPQVPLRFVGPKSFNVPDHLKGSPLQKENIQNNASPITPQKMPLHNLPTHDRQTTIPIYDPIQKDLNSPSSSPVNTQNVNTGRPRAPISPPQQYSIPKLNPLYNSPSPIQTPPTTQPSMQVPPSSNAHAAPQPIVNTPIAQPSSFQPPQPDRNTPVTPSTTTAPTVPTQDTTSSFQSTKTSSFGRRAAEDILNWMMDDPNSYLEDPFLSSEPVIQPDISPSPSVPSVGSQNPPVPMPFDSTPPESRQQTPRSSPAASPPRVALHHESKHFDIPPQVEKQVLINSPAMESVQEPIKAPLHQPAPVLIEPVVQPSQPAHVEDHTRCMEEINNYKTQVAVLQANLNKAIAEQEAAEDAMALLQETVALNAKELQRLKDEQFQTNSQLEDYKQQLVQSIHRQQATESKLIEHQTAVNELTQHNQRLVEQNQTVTGMLTMLTAETDNSLKLLNPEFYNRDLEDEEKKQKIKALERQLVQVFLMLRKEKGED